MNRFLFWFSVVCFALGLVCCIAGNFFLDLAYWYGALFMFQVFVYFLGLSGSFCWLMRTGMWRAHWVSWIVLAFFSAMFACSVVPK